MNESLDKVKEFRKNVLKDLYNQCTPEQQQFFCRMYKSIDEVPESKIDWAIQQCEKTIAKNKSIKKEPL